MIIPLLRDETTLKLEGFTLFASAESIFAAFFDILYGTWNVEFHFPDKLLYLKQTILLQLISLPSILFKELEREEQQGNGPNRNYVIPHG